MQLVIKVFNLYDVLQGLPKVNDPLSNLDFNYTLLVPSQQALAMFLNSTSTAFWTEEKNLQMILR